MDHNPFVAGRTVDLTLPSTGIKATIREPSLDQALEFSSKSEAMTSKEKADHLKTFIASLTTWDAKDVTDGSPVPVTADTLGYLPVDDGNAIVEAAMTFIKPKVGAEKKELPPSAAS